jgi:hypothetical protein
MDHLPDHVTLAHLVERAVRVDDAWMEEMGKRSSANARQEGAGGWPNNIVNRTGCRYAVSNASVRPRQSEGRQSVDNGPHTPPPTALIASVNTSEN